MNLKSTIKLHSGNAMPVIGLGTWELTDDTPSTIERALELGYPMIDTSGDYGTQPGIAEGIRRSGADRSDFYIVTKVEETDDAFTAAQRNVDELGIETADLILIHRPPESGAGEALWEGLLRARNEGITRDIGVSNYPAQLVDDLIAATGEAPVVNQIEWSPFGHSAAMLDHAKAHGIVIQAYSPMTRATRLNDHELQTMAERHGKSPAQILLRWDLQRGVVPLPKANRPEHLEENIDIFDFVLSNEDMVTLIRLNEHYSALGKLPYV